MPGFLNMGEMSALALHAMARLATLAGEDPKARVSVVDLAAGLESSPHTLHKVMTRLVAAGLVDSARGPSGGVRLALPADGVTVLMIVEAVDGKITSNGCLFSQRVCPAGEPCAFSGLTCGLEKKIREYFSKTTLENLASSSGWTVVLEKKNAGGRKKNSVH